MQRLDLSGKRVFRLIVTDEFEKRGIKIYWKCLCDCGVSKWVRADHLSSFSTTSCGCWRKDSGFLRGSESVKHGELVGIATMESDEYRVWTHMKQRCFNPNHKSYLYYGGRGITVCDRWKNSFAAFLEDMGRRPEGLSIDRFPDNNVNYEPGNCRWATASQQNANKRY
jgi:hypothetical protein